MNAPDKPLNREPPSLIAMLLWGLLAILVALGISALIFYILYGRHIQPE